MTQDNRAQSSGLLFEMLRSFVSLADTLNLSRTVRNLGSTRQTVRRHIAILEEARGRPLFDVIDRQYELTEDGRQALPEAEELLQRGKAWFEARLGHVNGLQRYSHVAEGLINYHTQQHALRKLWQVDSPMLGDCLVAWSQSRGELDHPSFEEVRPYGLVFREVQGRWLVTEVGEKSAFARWFGSTWARSSIGTPIDSLPGGDRFNAVTARAYQDVRTNFGVRYDHVVAGFVGGPEKAHNVIAFERLLMGSSYPDESFAVLSVARITPRVDIAELPPELRERVEFDAKLKDWAATAD